MQEGDTVQRGGGGADVGLGHPGNDADAGRAKPLPERLDIGVAPRENRINGIADPAGEYEAAGGDRLGCQQRVIQAAEPEADHQDDVHAEKSRQLGAGCVGGRTRVDRRNACISDDSNVSIS